jgi:predicted tellurium resistance membrane protein TerC
MLAFSKIVSAFVDKHPTVKMLALSFLVLIGVNLIADGLGHHVPRGYTYFAMAFSVGVEILNLRMRKSKEPPVHLRRNAPEGAGDQPSI